MFATSLNSSVASPICQEGQSERTFPIFAFSSRFFLFFPDFSWFSPIFGNFSLSGVALCPLDPPVATPLSLDACTYNSLRRFKDGKFSAAFVNSTKTNGLYAINVSNYPLKDSFGIYHNKGLAVKHDFYFPCHTWLYDVQNTPSTKIITTNQEQDDNIYNQFAQPFRCL